MDFSVILQLRGKRFWWIDAIFYFVISLLVATVFCYLIFLIKNNIQRKEIEKITIALETVGTSQQKEHEKTIISYQKKISDFTELFLNHEFASHVFTFVQENTMPNIWFKRFGLDKNNGKVQLYGETDDMEAFSRQVAHFEKNEYVKSIETLNSTIGESAKAQFNLNLALDPKIFSYVPETTSIQETLPVSDLTTPSEESEERKEKLITVFNLLLNPEAVGAIDQTNHTITIKVPYGTDLTNIQPLIISSRGTVVSPASGIAQDFSKPVIYKVTAEDGSVQDYTVKVDILPKITEESSQQRNNSTLTIIVIILILVVVTIISIVLLIFWKNFKNRKKIQT